VAWSADGSRVAAVTDSRVVVWDAATGRVLGPTRPGHEAIVHALAFAPDGTLYTGSDDHTVRGWDPAGRPGQVLRTSGWARGVAVSPDGGLVAGADIGNDLLVWEAKTGRERFRLLGHGDIGGTRVVRFTPDGARLVTWGDADEAVRVWDTRTGRLLAEHSTRPADEKRDPDEVFRNGFRMDLLIHPAVSPDGTMFASAEKGTVRLIDPMTGGTRRTVDTGLEWAQRAAFSPDGKRLAVAGRGKGAETKLPDGRIRHSGATEYSVSVWDLASGKRSWTATTPLWMYSELAFTPDGARLAAAGLDEKRPVVQLWDTATGADAGRVPLPSRGWFFAFDRSGRRLAVSFSDTTVVVYDLATALIPPGGKP
jgi:WD40 repeat protein